MKLLVAGAADPDFTAICLDRADAKRMVLLLVHFAGDAPAHDWAVSRGVPWLEMRRSETPAAVLGMVGPDGLVAFPGAPVALVAACRAAGLPVWEPAPSRAAPLIPASP